MKRGIRYNPLPTQARFHKLETRFKGFSGPVGSGKSQALCQEAIRAGVRERGMHGADRRADVPDAAGLDADLDGAGTRGERDSVRRQQGGKHADVYGHGIEDPVSVDGRLRAAEGHEPGVVRGGRVDLHARRRRGCGWKARLRDTKAQRLGGFAVWTPKGYDWVYRKFVAPGQTAYDTFVAKAYENTHLLKQIPDYYQRLEQSYDKRFFEQEVWGCI